MSKYGSTSYCYQCEKKIPWSSRCVYCRNPLCRNVGADGRLTCRCNCQLSQPNAIPMNPKTGGIGPIPDAKKP